MQRPDVGKPHKQIRMWTDDQKLANMADGWGADFHEHLPGASPEVVDYALDQLAAMRRSLLTLKARAIDAGRVCQVCGETFTPLRGTARYCSPACRQRAYRDAKKA